METELAALESAARALSSKADKVAREVEVSRADIQRLSDIGARVGKARDKERESIRSARLQRRAEFEEAKGALDEQLQVLRDLGVPGEPLAVARKRILTSLARSAIRAGTPGRHGSEGGVKDGIGPQLERLEQLALDAAADRAPAALEVIRQARAALEAALSASHGEIAKRQGVMSSHRKAVEACDQKEAEISGQIHRRQSAIEQGSQQLDELRSRLEALQPRIDELRAAIEIADLVGKLTRASEALEAKNYEDDVRRAAQIASDERLQELRRTTERLEACSRAVQAAEEASRPGDARPGARARAISLSQARASLETAAQGPSARAPELQRALSAIEQALFREDLDAHAPAPAHAHPRLLEK